MKKIICLALLIGITMPAWSMDGKEGNVKKGWSLGALPAVAFNSDLGFEYGLIVNLFNYGDGTSYPNYEHSLYFEVSRFTKGTGIFRAYYDSEYLLPGLHLTADLSYLPDAAYDFYGFNGYESIYEPMWEDDTDPMYRTRMFYKLKRNLFRAKADLQGSIAGENFRWIFGLTVRDFSIESVDIQKLNKGLEDDEKLPAVEDQPGLYERYIGWGLIPESEKNGGTITALKAGLVFDTRNTVQNPSKGVWTEGVLISAPSFLNDESFIKLSLTHRHYLPVITDRLTLALRAGYQQTLRGHTPFYMQPLMFASTYTGAWNEGLGGQRSIRGINRNRIIGDGFVYANFELRWIAWRFSMANQNFYLGFNAFYDTGRITDPIETGTLPAEAQPYFNSGNESFHHAAGMGLKLAMNWNFVLSVEYGQAFDEQDGTSSLYIALNYLF